MHFKIKAGYFELISGIRVPGSMWSGAKSYHTCCIDLIAQLHRTLIRYQYAKIRLAPTMSLASV